MEDALAPPFVLVCGVFEKVLILVVMEDALAPSLVLGKRGLP